MRTVKEVSELTKISVRTLHYYDAIGLLKPSDVTEAGYRLYDDKALETLQQILFFREFDVPLKEIKAIMENPELDRNQILQSQKKMLGLKKERIERLISSIDDILKGENRMDFGVFSKDEMEALYQAMISNMSDEMKQAIVQEYGELDKFHEHYMENAASEQVQKNYEVMLKWYGNKESALEAANSPREPQIMQSYQNRTDAIMKKLADQLGNDVTSFEVKALIGEYGFIIKQLYQLPDEKLLLLDMAASYRDNQQKLADALDGQYGAGTAAFFASAIEEFYK